MQNDKHSAIETIKVYLRFLSYVRPDRYIFLLGVFIIVILVSTNTAMIWLIGRPFDLLLKDEYEKIFNTLVIFISVVILNHGMHLCIGILFNWLGLRCIGRIRNHLLAHIVFLSLVDTHSYSKGDLLTRISGDIDKVYTCITEIPLLMISHLLTALFYIYMLFLIDTKLALIGLGLTPLFILNQRLFSPRKKAAAEQFFNKNGKLLAFEEEVISNMRAISTFNAEKYINKLHQRAFENTRRWRMKDLTLTVLFNSTFSLLVYATAVVIVFLGVQGIQQGYLELGHFISFLLYLGYLTYPVKGLADSLFQYTGNYGVAKRILEVLSTQKKVLEKPNAHPLHLREGTIELRNVTFSYPDSSNIFSHLNLTIKSGETVALVGPSGSGKSTFALLLTRFYDTQSGDIFLDGSNIKDVTISSLRKKMTVVWQEPFLISDSIRANFQWVKPNVTDQNIQEACEASFAWEFIEKLPHGLNTKLGSDGNTLSSGQKQRLAIAQAFLRDTRILILDEASAALDSRAEKEIFEALCQTDKKRTLLIIAHRYSTIKSVNRVIYFNGDGTVTVGQHQDLMNNHPGYKQAVEWQMIKK